MTTYNFELINWQIPQFDDANCLTVGDPDLVFPNGKVGASREQIIAAKKVCIGCVHKNECAEFAIENEIDYGVWGGIDEHERRRLLKMRAKKAS